MRPCYFWAHYRKRDDFCDYVRSATHLEVKSENKAPEPAPAFDAHGPLSSREKLRPESVQGWSCRQGETHHALSWKMGKALPPMFAIF